MQPAYSSGMGGSGSPHGGGAARTEDPEIPEPLGFPECGMGKGLGFNVIVL